MWISFAKEFAKKILFGFCGIKLRFKIWIKRKLHGNLVVLISTAYWGNVGDHAIVLGEKEIIKSAGMDNKIVDIDSVQCERLLKILKETIHVDDLIVIDGGGNFGDIWPGTQKGINNIIEAFLKNRIVIFPESWYFTNSEEGTSLLAETVKTISRHKHIVIYARDSFSYKMMKTNLPETDIRQSLDSVFMLDFSASDVAEQGVALVVRDDRESINVMFSKTVLEKELNVRGIACFEIKNDCYRHISKKKRKDYVYEIVGQYKKASIVITDRFHGMVLSIICGKPCVIIDNKTGKVGNSFKDIKDDLDGILYINDKQNTIEDVLEFIEKKPVLSVYDSFRERVEKNKRELVNIIKGEES